MFERSQFTNLTTSKGIAIITAISIALIGIVLMALKAVH